MANALIRHHEGNPTNRWVGDIYGVSDTDFEGTLWDTYGMDGEEMGAIRIPLANIVEVERPKVVRGALFWCDVVADPDDPDGDFRIVGIEFEDGLTERLRPLPYIALLDLIYSMGDRVIVLGGDSV